MAEFMVFEAELFLMRTGATVAMGADGRAGREVEFTAIEVEGLRG